MSRPHLYLHLQPVGGIAGDMFVAAMLDAFPQYREQVLADIAAVVPREVGTVRVAQVLKNGIAALHFSLDEHGGAPAADSPPGAAYRRVAAQASGFRPHAQRPAPHKPPVSDYAGIKQLIASAQLSGTTAAHALAILEIIAKAEAHIHGVALEKVHFHELAAWDSLMDVVAAGSIISALGDASWSISALPLGSGMVKTQHGLLPVPAPATMRILEAYPWRSDSVAGERVTPTGAAIVRYLVPPQQAARKPEGVLRAGGYGAGTKNFAELPNVLRVMAFEPFESLESAPQTASDQTSVALIEFDVDDMSGEEIGVAAERLRGAPGLLDLLLVAAQGKKGRPVTIFRLLVEPLALARCRDLVFHETSTIGLRWVLMERTVLPRQAQVSAEGLRMKEVLRPNGERTSKIESDDLQSLAGLKLRRQTKMKAEGYL